jgi:hypothetical protein
MAARQVVGAVLDLENLLHEERRTSRAAVEAAFTAIVAELHDLGEVRFAVGCCDWWLAKVLCPVAASLGVRVHPGPLGHDRADGELLRRVDDVPRSVDMLVVGSGDRVFAPAVGRQRAAGRSVVVLARPGRVSRALADACDIVIELPEPDAHAA